MLEYTIDVTEIEELQTIKNVDSLDIIFGRAERMIVGGGKVILVRRNPDGKKHKFDEISTESDLHAYRNSVYKYL